MKLNLRVKLPKRQSAPKQDNTLQNWLPVKDIRSSLLLRTDGVPVAVVAVEAAPFKLLSDRERSRRVSALYEAVQNLPAAAQICAVSRPLDLDSYLASLEVALAEASAARRTMLRGYYSYVRSLAAGGQAVERSFYVLISGEKRKGGTDELLSRAREFAAALARADLSAHIADEREILELLFTFFHPAQAAFERPQETATPLYVEEVIPHGAG